MPSTPTLSAMISEVEREIKMRKEVYGRQVSGGKLRAAEAQYKIGLMEEVRGVLVWLEGIGRDDLKAYIAERKAKADGVSSSTAGSEAGAD